MSRFGFLLCAVVALGADSRAAAQGVRWRPTLDAARKEAAETGKPMFLDVGTEDCIWCRRLDATTFRDAGVVALLNDRFIPVRVDGEQEARLVQSLGITGFPTLVAAGPDGRVIDRQNGFADVAKMTAFLERCAPARPRSPAAEQLALARADFDGQRYLACALRCQNLAATYPDTGEGRTARALADRITADPAAWSRIGTQLNARLDELYSSLDAGLRR